MSDKYDPGQMINLAKWRFDHIELTEHSILSLINMKAIFYGMSMIQVKYSAMQVFYLD